MSGHEVRIVILSKFRWLMTIEGTSNERDVWPTLCERDGWHSYYNGGSAGSFPVLVKSSELRGLTIANSGMRTVRAMSFKRSVPSCVSKCHTAQN